MSKDRIKIEVNGKTLRASPGQMLIEVTDAAGIYIPRFCYHEKLSVAANCRLCLVEVEKVGKPLPACATPVADGMQVFTKSPRAIAAQKATMEFLLINHPLDCPICDQGGECELQDLAMGYGRDVSRYAERKRVVKDKDLGPLVSTDMTRCIHCTRCVRFGQEIAGIQELGTLGRGDRTEIGTFIERSVDHELSGNIIDLCPVGALNNKPYRFSARAWEMEQRDSVAPHDCLGANIHLHVLGGRVKRVVPKTNEAVNETWASDRDRFSYEGIYSSDRITTPMVRRGEALVACAWDEALEVAANILKDAGSESAALVSPSTTTEAGYLAQRILRHLGSADIDHRLMRQDFRDQDADPLFPWLGLSVADLEQQDCVLIVGSDLRREVPLLAHRVRKAALAGARIAFVNTTAVDMLFPVAAQHVNEKLCAELQQLLAASGNDSRAQTVAALRAADKALVLLGNAASRDSQFAQLRRLAAQLARDAGAQLGYLSEGANAAGLSLAGVLPHRNLGGESSPNKGRHVAELLQSSPRALLLLGVEARCDLPSRESADALLSNADDVLAISTFMDDAIAAHAKVVLPVGSFAETAGSFVNVEGRWQSFAGAASPVGESRPAWKVLRVLGNLLELPDCEYLSADEVTRELRAAVGELELDNRLQTNGDLSSEDGISPPSVTLYQVDALVRRAPSLQQTNQARGETAASPSRRVA